MKKKIGCLLVLTFFVNTVQPVNWWPFSFFSKDKNLSPVAKEIRTIIVTCKDASLDTKFDLIRFLEKEQPRTVYEWVKILKINYAITTATQALAKVNADTTTQYFELPSPNAQRTTGNKSATLAYWNDNIQNYKNQRSLVEPRLSFLPNVGLSTTDRNSINPNCADKIITNLEKAFPNLTVQSPLSTSLPADQAAILLQSLTALPAQQQALIKNILETHSINELFLFFQLWAVNSEPTQNDVKTTLIAKIAEITWHNGPEGQALHTQQTVTYQAEKEYQTCQGHVRAHDTMDCNAESKALSAAQSALQKLTTKYEPVEAIYKETFAQTFNAKPEASLAIPNPVAQTAIRYLQSYYPQLQ